MNTITFDSEKTAITATISSSVYQKKLRWFEQDLPSFLLTINTLSQFKEIDFAE